MPVRSDCPRCGYDLSGTMITWTTACPLEGTCSECGLSMRWGDVFDSAKRWPTWAYEHANIWNIWAFFRTAVCSLWPWSFWRRLTMYLPVNVPRLLIYAVVLLAPYAAAWSLFLHVERSTLTVYTPYSNTPSFGGDWNMAVHLWVRGHRKQDGFVWMWAGLVPICFVALPQTLRRTRVRFAHILRAGVYSLLGPWLFMVAQFLTLWGVVVVMSSPLFGQTTSLTYVQFFDSMLPIIQTLRSPWATIALTASWLVFWWYLAAKRYLHLPHAAGVAAAFALLTGLVAIIVMSGVFGLSLTWFTNV